MENGYLSSYGTKPIKSQSCDPVSEAKPRTSYMRFVEGLLGAAASLETSPENPAAW